jgi:hypothetical protein
MEGKLFTIQDPGDSPESSFIERYFISFPFCGLKWFNSGSDEKDKDFTISSKEGGWVYGGSLHVLSVYKEEKIVVKVKDMHKRALKTKLELYPFVLRIFSEAFGDFSVFLATESSIVRDDWVRFLNYIYLQY